MKGIKSREKIGFFLVLAMLISTCFGFTLNAQAAVSKDNNLPKGWTSLGLNNANLKDAKKVNNNISPFAPAPPLTSLEIIDLAIDERNEIHIVTEEIGTSRAGSSLAWWNGSQCQENINEGYYLWGSDGIAYGYVRFFHTGVYYSSNVSGQNVMTSAQATNAMNPWNTLSTSRNFILP